MSMEISQNGLEFIKNEEGCILHPYRDQAGLLSIGVGHLLTSSEKAAGAVTINGASVPYANGITEQQALDLLRQDVKRTEDAINNLVKRRLTQNQFDACVSLAFNIGTGGFAASSALVAINAGKLDEVAADFAKWNKITVGGQRQVCDDLVARRQREGELFNA